MKTYFSGSLGGFCHLELIGSLPDDAVELTEKQYHDLLDGQSAGKRIVAGADGKPVLADPPAPTAEQLAASARLQRDGLVGQTDWIVARHRDQVEGSLKTSLTSAQYAALMAYRQALRDVPLQKGFPSAVSWPAPPDWLAALIQS